MANRTSQDAVEVVGFGPTKARLSQDAVEVLYKPLPGVDHVSQVAIEVLESTPTRVSQVATEVVTPRPGGKLSQEAVEVLGRGPTKARVSQDATEVLYHSPPGGRVSQNAVEVITPATAVSLEHIVSQVAVEVMDPNPSVLPGVEGILQSQTTLEVIRPYGKELYIWYRQNS